MVQRDRWSVGWREPAHAGEAGLASFQVESLSAAMSQLPSPAIVRADRGPGKRSSGMRALGTLTPEGLPTAPSPAAGSSALALRVSGWGLLASALLLTPPARAVDLPRPGVVCDPPQQICFDSQGPSLELTRLYLGSRASNRLLTQLSGRPAMAEFVLSDGQLCDLRLRSCFDDGQRRRQFNPLLSRHLFGATSPSGTRPTAAAPDPSLERNCQLSQRGMVVFSGACRLSRQNDGSGSVYGVKVGSGQRYRFQRRGPLLVLNDASGTWPVALVDRGSSVQFRWANLMLDVVRPPLAYGGRSSSPLPPSPRPQSTGEGGTDLIDSLFPR
jgi:hypothetical protein